MEKEDLLKMKIGTTKWVGGNGVMRVYNGWIYLFHDEVSDTITSSVFVPEVINIYSK